MLLLHQTSMQHRSSVIIVYDYSKPQNYDRRISVAWEGGFCGTNLIILSKVKSFCVTVHKLFPTSLSSLPFLLPLISLQVQGVQGQFVCQRVSDLVEENFKQR